MRVAGTAYTFTVLGRPVGFTSSSSMRSVPSGRSSGENFTNASCDIATMRCGFCTYGKRIGSLSTTTCALQAEPRASGPKAWVRHEYLLSNSAAALPMMMPPRMTPWPPSPPILISVGPMSVILLSAFTPATSRRRARRTARTSRRAPPCIRCSIASSSVGRSRSTNFPTVISLR